MTDAVGAQVQRKSYAPYGAGLSQATGYHEAKDFIGERLDEETGLLYLNARYYDPVLGRFISADPLLPGVGVNRYAYAGNNPVMYSDPYGLMFGRSPMESRSAEPGLVGDEGFSDHGLGFGSGDRDENWASDQSSESLVEYDYPPEDEDWFITRRPTATAVKLTTSNIQQADAFGTIIQLLMQAGETMFGPAARRDIMRYGLEINQAGQAFGVDSDLIRGIIFEEQTHQLPLEDFAEQFGIGDTVGLGQVTVGLLGYTRQELLDPETNIRAMAQHLSNIQQQSLIDSHAPFESIATKYNCGSCTSISEYGRRVARFRSEFAGGAPF